MFTGYKIKKYLKGLGVGCSSIRIIISILFIYMALNSINTVNKAQGNYTDFYRSSEVGFALNEVAPRLFTPDEGDTVKFSFENPNFSEVTIRIFDITGIEVKKNIARESENVMYWDGTDENNDIVSGGIYIYQIETGENLINGTVVVAR